MDQKRVFSAKRGSVENVTGDLIVLDLPLVDFGAQPSEHPENTIEIRANKRWLAKRLRDLSALEPSKAEECEAKAVRMALGALRTKRGAAAYRKKLKAGNIRISPTGDIFLTDFGVAKTPAAYTVVAIPRKKQQSSLMNTGESGADERIPQAFRLSVAETLAEPPTEARADEIGAAQRRNATIRGKSKDVKLFRKHAERHGRKDDVL